MTQNNLNYYLDLPFPVVVQRDPDGDYVARINELPGCAAHGSSASDALEHLEEAKTLWITDAFEAGDPIPTPVTDEGLPSGKWVQRVPRTLHRKLTQLAERENASLNQLVTSILSEAVGTRTRPQLSAEGHARNWAKLVTSKCFDDWYPQATEVAEWMVWDMTFERRPRLDADHVRVLSEKIPFSIEVKTSGKKESETHGRFRQLLHGLP